MTQQRQASKRPRSQPPRSIDPANAPPTEMIGVWRQVFPHPGSDFEIMTDAYQYIIQYPVPYSISADGSTLNWDGWIFRRTAGSGAVIQGVWETDDSAKEEIHFRTDGTYTYHDPNSVPDLFGTYQDTGTDLGSKEMRAVLSIDGDELDHDPVFYPSKRYQWAINGDDMTWIELSSGEEYRFVRV